VGVLKYILGEPQPGTADEIPPDVDDVDPLVSRYASAEAAIDRAVQQLKAANAGNDRRDTVLDDRRVGLPDTRPSGAPERRLEAARDRRTIGAGGFGKRNRPH
jgi:hypothetical protein